MGKWASKYLHLVLLASVGFVCTCGQLSARAHNNHHSSSSSSSSSSENNHISKHNIQLQLFDCYGFAVAGTEFWVTLKVIKDGPKVTLQIPLINFETGPFANSPDEFFPPFVNGGYLYTVDGFLPEDLRPSDIVYRTWLAATDNGALLSYSFTEDPSDIPPPATGYMISVTDAGALVVQGAGSVGNLIPPGPQTLLPTDVTYIAEKAPKLTHNTKISRGKTNVTLFTNPLAINQGLRDSHFNDAFDGLAAWTWTDNSMVADKTNGTLNVMVAFGKKGKDGKLKMRKPIQLTDFPPEVFAFDTAVAINRANKKNIVVSYARLDATQPPTNGLAPGQRYAAVSFDGGKTWPYNGPINLQPTGNPSSTGDNRGVASDKFGNIWYSTSNLNDASGNDIGQAVFLVSSDGGITYQEVLTLPEPPPETLFDFPQFCFGGDGFGNYGLWFSVDFGSFATFDIFPYVGFIPITGLGQIGTPNFTPLPDFLNQNQIAGITASMDGRVWLLGYPSGLFPMATSILPVETIFKSPGPIDQNYAGPWAFATIDIQTFFWTGPTLFKSEPNSFGYFLSPQSNIYDDKLQALYAMTQRQRPDFSQNMRLSFAISRDNAQTWTTALNVSNSNHGNRGFQSMALDPVKGDLYFGWYDGRNDPSEETIEYYGAVIPHHQLKEMVKEIPLSNPLYTLPSAAVPTGQPNGE